MRVHAQLDEDPNSTTDGHKNSVQGPQAHEMRVRRVQQTHQHSTSRVRPGALDLVHSLTAPETQQRRQPDVSPHGQQHTD